MVTVDRVIELAEHYQKVFNLQSWMIHCYIAKLAEMPVDGAWGNIVVEHEYMRARITVAEETPDEHLEHVVCHEIAHILVAMLHDNALYLVDEIDNKKRRKRERQILNDDSERATEMIARAIRRLENETASGLQFAGCHSIGG